MSERLHNRTRKAHGVWTSRFYIVAENEGDDGRGMAAVLIAGLLSEENFGATYCVYID